MVVLIKYKGKGEVKFARIPPALPTAVLLAIKQFTTLFMSFVVNAANDTPPPSSLECVNELQRFDN